MLETRASSTRASASTSGARPTRLDERHADYFLELVEAARRGARTEDDERTRPPLRTSSTIFRRALATLSASGDVERELRLATAAFWGLWTRGSLRELHGWLDVGARACRRVSIRGWRAEALGAAALAAANSGRLPRVGVTRARASCSRASDGTRRQIEWACACSASTSRTSRRGGGCSTSASGFFASSGTTPGSAGLPILRGSGARRGRQASRRRGRRSRGGGDLRAAWVVAGRRRMREVWQRACARRGRRRGAAGSIEVVESSDLDRRRSSSSRVRSSRCAGRRRRHRSRSGPGCRGAAAAARSRRSPTERGSARPRLRPARAGSSGAESRASGSATASSASGRPARRSTLDEVVALALGEEA